MDRRKKEYIRTNNASPAIFVPKSDYANSELLYKLDEVTEFSLYTITKYDNRVDLISEDIYGEDKYSWILMYVNRMDIADFKRGVTIKYIPKNNLKSILNDV